MGFGRRVKRKSVRRLTPRSVRYARHPVRRLKYKAVPRPIRRASRAAYMIRNPVGAAENKLIGAVLYPRRRKRSPSRKRSASATRQREAPTSRRPTTASALRATEGVQSELLLDGLLAVRHDRFDAAQPPKVLLAEPVDPRPIMQREWAIHRKDLHFWQRTARKLLRSEIAERADHEAVQAYAEAKERVRQEQLTAANHWGRLTAGEPDVMREALNGALASGPIRATVWEAAGDAASLVLLLPGPETLPTKGQHVTPAGRMSSKTLTKTELNEHYVQLLGAHLVATLRRACAAAPSLRRLRIVGLRWREEQYEVLFDVDIERETGAQDDESGYRILTTGAGSLHRVGQAHEVTGWPADAVHEDVRALAAAWG